MTDEKARSVALTYLAQIKAGVGDGDGVRSVVGLIHVHRPLHLPRIVAALVPCARASGKARELLDSLILDCAFHVGSALAVCGSLAHLHTKDIAVILRHLRAMCPPPN